MNRWLGPLLTFAAFAAFAASTTLAGTAHAQPGAPPNATVILLPPTCTGSLDVDSFAGILTAELRQDGVERVAPAEGVAALATISLAIEPCAAGTPAVTVTIEDRATSKRVIRRIALQDVSAPARPRTLALAVAELLRASWLELAVPEVPPPEAPVPPAVREAVIRHLTVALPEASREDVTPLESDRARQGSLAIAWRAFLGGNASMLGARGAVALPIRAMPLLLRVDAGGAYATTQDPIGDVNLGLASGGIALVYVSPLARSVSFELGPRVELGAAWASGKPLDQQTSSNGGVGFIGTASALGVVLMRLAPAWRLAVELEAGGVFAPFEATADGRPVTGVKGGMLGLTIGLLTLR